MDATSPIATRLQHLVRRQNREFALSALVQALLGVLFSLFTLGFLFWLGWLVGWFAGSSLPLKPWQVGAILAGLFLVVATWSAWRKVNPLAGLPRLNDHHWLLKQLSLPVVGLPYFSPRHALAGSAVLLLAGPSSVFQALGLWAHRLRADRAVIEEAAQLLTSCSESCPIEEIHTVRAAAAALLLRRLALIKAVPQAESVAFTVTDKGSNILAKAKRKAAL